MTSRQGDDLTLYLPCYCKKMCLEQGNRHLFCSILANKGKAT